MTPTLAIMIPAYGDSPLLREAVTSVLTQDVEEWSLTVVDDGPVDPVLAGWLAGLDPRVEYVRNENRLGINRNFQRCLELADAPLVELLGADDRLLPSYVRTMAAAADAYPMAAWLHPRVRVIDATGRCAPGLADRVKARIALDPPAYVGGEHLAVSLLRGDWMYFPAVTFRTEIVRRYGFRGGLELVQDLDLYLRMLQGGESAVLVDERCFEYRRHEASLSSEQRDSGERFTEEAAYFRQVAADLDAHGWPRAARAARWHVTSRLHAAVGVPGALLGRRWSTARALADHLVH